MSKRESGVTKMSDNETGAAVISEFQYRLADLSLYAQTVKGHMPQSVQYYSGIAHKFDADIENWRRQYGDGIVGSALREIENDFPDLDNPSLFYWTTNEDIQDEQANYYDRFADALGEAARRMQNEVEKAAQEYEEEQRRREEYEENRQRAREQAERARETEMRWKQAADAFETGLSGRAGIKGVAQKIGKFITGLFRRRS